MGAAYGAVIGASVRKNLVRKETVRSVNKNIPILSRRSAIVKCGWLVGESLRTRSRTLNPIDLDAAGHYPLSRSLLVFGCALFLVLGSPTRGESNDESAIARLSYPGSYDVRTLDDPQSSTLTVSFKKKAAYPSSAVVQFYDGELRRKGWIPFTQPGLREWSCFEDGIALGNPLVHQFGVTWTSMQTRRMALLILKYESHREGKRGANCPAPDNDTQQVHLQFMPFTPLPSQSPVSPKEDRPKN
jgi:hypothetical protein